MLHDISEPANSGREGARARIAMPGYGGPLLAALAEALEKAGMQVMHVPAPGSGPDQDGAEDCSFGGPADVMLVDLDATTDRARQMLGVLSERAEAALIAVTARANDADELSALSRGADDYLDLTEPREKLVMRVRAVLRRLWVSVPRPATDDARVIRQGPLEIDLDRRRATWRNREVPLSRTELQVLAALARRPGFVRTRAQLLDAAGEDGLEQTDRAIDSHIKRLRKKLRAQDPQFAAIRTLYGVGYSFTPI